MTAASYFAVPEPPAKLLHKHDLVTIIVNEQSAYSTNGVNDLEKAADFDTQIADYLNIDPSRIAGQPPSSRPIPSNSNPSPRAI